MLDILKFYNVTDSCLKKKLRQYEWVIDFWILFKHAKSQADFRFHKKVKAKSSST